MPRIFSGEIHARVVINVTEPKIQLSDVRIDTRARSYQFAQVLELMQQNEQKEQFFMVIRNSRTCS